MLAYSPVDTVSVLASSRSDRGASIPLMVSWAKQGRFNPAGHFKSEAKVDLNKDDSCPTGNPISANPARPQVEVEGDAHSKHTL